MSRFAANLTLLFNELPMLQRFQAARQAGFQGVEILFPYDLAVGELRQAAHKSAMDVVLINCPPPNRAGGPRGFSAVPGLEDRFQRDFERALRVAQALSARHIHVMAGKAEGAAARDCYISNLSWAAHRAPHASLTIEPMSDFDMPGYFLNDFDQAALILDDVGASNLGLQFDAYQAHMITGDVLAAWHEHGHRARHIQIAGAPGRHEPREGDIDYQAFFEAVDKSGYSGWVAAEYTPATTTEAGLRWMRAESE